MEQSWQDWIQTSIDMGCDREALRAILEQNNFSAEDIRIHLDAQKRAQNLTSLVQSTMRR